MQPKDIRRADLQALIDRMLEDDIEARVLLAALPRERALWATAMYAGLRLGRAARPGVGGHRLRPQARPRPPLVGSGGWSVAPKSRAVPLTDTLRRHLTEHRLACGWRSGLVFGRSADRPFATNTPNDRAQRAWKALSLRVESFVDDRENGRVVFVRPRRKKLLGI